MCSKNELQTVTQSVIRAALELLSDKIYKIILYGSYARGDFDLESDVVLRNILFDAVICRIQQIKSGRSRTSSCSA